jgi:hypothetical protein
MGTQMNADERRWMQRFSRDILKSRWMAIAILLFFLFMGEEVAIAKAINISHQQNKRATTQKNHFEVSQEKQSSIGQEQLTDYECESSELIINLLYRRLSSFSDLMSATGANGANVEWEKKRTDEWYIEVQRYGEGLIIGGLIKNDEKAIKAGFKMFDWGFARQSDDGGFAGTGDPFHSTAFFIQAVAHSLLAIQQSPHASKYADKVAHYKPLVHRAARWMILPEVWQKGIKHDKPYTHRRYLDAAALGLTGKLTGDRELVEYARQLISDGLALQRPDGVNPEKGGHDSSYQMVGVVYAQRWVTYFPEDSLTPKVETMVEKALAWVEKKVLATGEISTQENTRSAGQESGRAGDLKKIDYKTAIRGFAYWAAVTQNSKWGAIAQKIAKFYY